MNYVAQLLTEAQLGCLMVKFPDYDAFEIIKWVEKSIPEDTLTDNGIEREVHTTVAYGFAPDVYAQEVFDMVQKITGGKSIPLQLGKISRFSTNPKYDVIKVDVESKELERIHRALRDIFGQRLNVTFKDFKAHLTLAYVKKGAMPMIDGHCKFLGDTYVGKEFIFSTPNARDKKSLILSESSRVIVNLIM